MRILLNTKPILLSRKTGIGYYVFHLLRELQNSGIEVYPTIDRGSQTFVNTLREVSSGVRKMLGKWYPSVAVRSGDLLITYLFEKGKGRVEYDLYHETGSDAIPDRKIKTVCNLYDLSFITCPEFLPGGFYERWGGAIEKNVRASQRVIVNTEFIKREAVRLLSLPEDRIDVIPLAPSSVHRRKEDPASGNPMPKKYTAKNYVLYVGTVEPRKNLKTLIRAFRDIRKKHDLSLIIAGRAGWLYEDILSYPEEIGIAGEVTFTGYVDETSLSELYRQASVFVYPSRYEGFGLPPLEAMVCGAPVILSDIPPLREVAGEGAIFFEPESHEDLANAMDRVLSSEPLREKLKAKGAERVKDYTWGKVAAATILTYTKALKA